MTTFGSLLHHYRLRAGLGLRTFATLVEERASAVSAVESGRRLPWRRERTLQRTAEVLGLVEASQSWEQMVELAQESSVLSTPLDGSLLWWWTTEDSPALDNDTAAEMAEFLGVEFSSEKTSLYEDNDSESLTDLGIEWRVRQLLGRRSTPLATAPVDVESVLENEADVRLEIVPGLIPRFSVQACVLRSAEQTTIVVDRIVADSRPTASYRNLLAQCYAPAVLWQWTSELKGAGWFLQWQLCEDWLGMSHNCARFALAMQLPATPLLAGAESAYRELVEQQGWVEFEAAACSVRNRLAEQFAVPQALVHRRLLGWPCHLYGRIAQALAAEEPTLPPADWIADDAPARQRLLFEKHIPQRG
jgi:transcriptional regulator with XRE-family HTH domain